MSCCIGNFSIQFQATSRERRQSSGEVEATDATEVPTETDAKAMGGASG